MRNTSAFNTPSPASNRPATSTDDRDDAVHTPVNVPQREPSHSPVKNLTTSNNADGGGSSSSSSGGGGDGGGGSGSSTSEESSFPVIVPELDQKVTFGLASGPAASKKRSALTALEAGGATGAKRSKPEQQQQQQRRQQQQQQHEQHVSELATLPAASSCSSSGGSKRNNLTPEAIHIMKSWMFSPEHFECPYPTEAEKRSMADAAGLSIKQLCNWFTNARKRLWQPLLRQRGDNVERFLNTAKRSRGGSGRRGGRSEGSAASPGGLEDGDENGEEGFAAPGESFQRAISAAAMADSAAKAAPMTISAPRGAALAHALASKRGAGAEAAEAAAEEWRGGAPLWRSVGDDVGHVAPPRGGGFGGGFGGGYSGGVVGAHPAVQRRPEVEIRACEALLQLLVQ